MTKLIRPRIARSIVWAFLISLLTVAQPLQPAMAQTVDVGGLALNFAAANSVAISGASMTVGTAGKAVGDIVKYKNVVTVNGIAVDAVVTTKAITGFTTISTYDSPGSASSAVGNFQVDFTTTAASGGQATFSFAFYEAGTYTGANTGVPITLKNITVQSIDLDAASTTDLQYTDFSGFQRYTLTTDTNIKSITKQTTTTPYTTRFLTADTKNSASIPQDMVSVSYQSFSTFDVTVGNVKNALGYYGVQFGPANWGTSTTTSVTNANNTPPTSNNVSKYVAGLSKTVLSRSDFGAYADLDNNPFYSVKVTALPNYGSLEYNDGSKWVAVALNQEILTSDIDLGKLRYSAHASTNGVFSFQVGDSLAYSPSYTSTFAITAQGQVITFTNPGQKTPSQNFSSGATTDASGLTPTLTSSTTGICTVTVLQIYILSSSGFCTITATQSGNATYSAATPVTQTFPVSALTPQTITFNNPGDKLLSSGSMVITPTTTASGLTPTLTSYTPTVCTVSTTPALYTVTFLMVGYCDLKSTEPGNTTYAPASPVEWIFQITAATDEYITYDGNGGTGGPAVQKFSAPTTSLTISSTTPTRTGYNFVNWRTTKSGGTTYTSGQTGTSFSTSATLYAQWSPISYHVTYNGNGNTSGTEPTQQTFTLDTTPVSQIESTSVVTEPATAIVKNSYSFTGWNTLANGTGASFSVGTNYATAADLTLYAIWAPLGSISITYDGNGALTAVPSMETFTVGNSAPISGTPRPTRAGYTFEGWDTAADGTGAHYAVADTYSGTTSLKLYAVWKAINYVLIYDKNGGSGTAPGRQIYTVSSFPTIPTTDVNRPGYFFDGWNTLANGLGTDYLETDTYVETTTTTSVLYAQWILNDYVVHFEANGGTVVEGSPLPSDVPTDISFTVVSGAHIPNAVTSFHRTGYDFDGWNTQPNGSGLTFVTADIYKLPSDLILYANWALKNYAVVYERNGGTGMAPTRQVFNVESGVTIADIWNYIEPSTADLYRTGYTFTHWNTLSSGGTSYTPGDTYTVAADLTLYAQWAPVLYTITYNKNNSLASGSTGPTSFTIDTGAHPADNGFSFDATIVFSNWNTRADGKGTSYTPADLYKTAGDITLYAIWQPAASHALIYSINGGSGTSPATVVVTGSATKSLASSSGFSRAGYTFTGWNTQANAGGTSYVSGASFTINSNSTLYAQWSANTYTLSYNSNGATTGITPTAQTFTVIAGTPVATTTLSRTGYTFDGWWNNATNGAGAITFLNGDTYIDPADLTLYAMWTPVDYTITYDPNSGQGVTPVNQTFSVENAAIIADGSSTMYRTGYTFHGWWNTQADGAGTDSFAAGDSYNQPTNLTLYAVWTPINYSIIYDKNGGTGTNPAKQVFTMNTSGVQINDGSGLTRGDGYTFDGWNTQSDGSGTSFLSPDIYLDTYNLNLYAMWSLNEFTLSYDANGGTGTLPGDQNFTVENGVYVVDISVPHDPTYTLTRSDFDFYGWWNTAADATGTRTFVPGEYVNDPTDVTLYALWVPSGSKALIYDRNGGTGDLPLDKILPTNTVVTIDSKPANLARAGFTFTGWFTTQSTGGSELVPATTTTLSTNITAYARWTSISYNLSYNANGGSGSVPASATFTVGGSAYLVASKPDTLARSGYTFLSWNTAAAGTGDDWFETDTFTVTASTPTNTTFYAMWDPIEYTVFYDINGADSGTHPLAQVFTLYSGDVFRTVNLSKAGTAITSWNTQADGYGTRYALGVTYNLPADLLIYAQYGEHSSGDGGGYEPPPAPPVPTPVVPTPTPVVPTPTPTPTKAPTINITGSIKTQAAPKKIVANQIVKVVQTITATPSESGVKPEIVEVDINGKKVKAKIAANGAITLPQLVGPKDKIVIIEKVGDQEISVPVQSNNDAISLANVNFDLASSKLTPAAKKILDKVAAVMKSHGFTSLTLTGHTDIQASAGYNNQLLSEQRAAQVRAYLKAKLAGQKIEIKISGKAAVDLLSSKTDASSHALNRRVEIIVH